MGRATAFHAKGKPLPGVRPHRRTVGEALDLLSALNTGHDGALSTVHANSSLETLRRLETLALMADVGLPHTAIREQIGRGIDLTAHLSRAADGSRRLVEIAEVVLTAGSPGIRELWRRDP